MSKFGGGGLIVAAVVLVLIGLFLRWDLIDWLIDAMGAPRAVLARPSCSSSQVSALA